MKKDMRITYPIWQVVAILFLITFLLLTSVQGELGVIWGVYCLVFVAYLALFFLNVSRHNKKMPKHKINVFSMKPQEYMEDDELFQEVTKRAAKRVYSYFIWSLPFFAGLSWGFKIGTVGMVAGLLLLSMGQYLIYYKEIKKYTEVDE